jgi:non-ribosomal peptide synthetase component E (peptide arylation enzyme)
MLTSRVYRSIINRFSSTAIKARIPSTKLTKSYYYHASEIPLIYDTIGQHLDKLANEYPNHECYAFKGEGNKRYTYKSFLDEVDSLATSLIELGFEKNDRLGVWLPNTSENCALTYAASKVGLIKVIHLIPNSRFRFFFIRLISILRIWIVNYPIV